EAIFNSAPNKGKVSKTGQAIMVSLAIIFGIVVIYLGNINLVANLLLLFIVINYLGWIYLKKFVESTINTDLSEYQTNNNFIKFEMLLKVKDYLLGEWQTIRFIFALIFI